MAKKMKKPKKVERAVKKKRRPPLSRNDVFNIAIDECAKAVPTNWCDTLLTGPEAPKAGDPFGGRAIERLLRGVQDRIRALKTAQ